MKTYQKKSGKNNFSFKQEVRFQLKDLNKLLFGTEPSESWRKGNFGTHGLNILKILLKTRINFWLFKNVIKSNLSIGFNNIFE